MLEEAVPEGLTPREGTHVLGRLGKTEACEKFMEDCFL